MIAYRLATHADAPAVLSLLEEIMEHHGVTPPERPTLLAVISSIIAAPDHCFLLAEISGEDAPAAARPAVADAHQAGEAAPSIAGMCALVFSISTWSASLVCELQDVVVTEERRREDIGRGLVASAEKLARERGCSRLFLSAESWNFEAHRFYRALGLQEKTCLYFERDLTSPH